MKSRHPFLFYTFLQRTLSPAHSTFTVKIKAGSRQTKARWHKSIYGRRRSFNVKDLATFFTFKMAMGRAKGIVTKGAFSKIQGVHQLVFTKKLQRIVHCGSRKRRHLGVEFGINHIHRRMVSFLQQIRQHLDPLNGRPYLFLQENVGYVFQSPLPVT